MNTWQVGFQSGTTHLESSLIVPQNDEQSEILFLSTNPRDLKMYLDIILDMNVHRGHMNKSSNIETPNVYQPTRT